LPASPKRLGHKWVTPGVLRADYRVYTEALTRPKSSQKRRNWQPAWPIGSGINLETGVNSEVLWHDRPKFSFLSCGYALANAGHDTRAIQAWMGHKNIQHTVRYTELSPTRFKDFWRE